MVAQKDSIIKDLRADLEYERWRIAQIKVKVMQDMLSSSERLWDLWAIESTECVIKSFSKEQEWDFDEGYEALRLSALKSEKSKLKKLLKEKPMEKRQQDAVSAYRDILRYLFN